MFIQNLTTLRWRHNERDGVPNYRRLDCLLSRLFKRSSADERKHQSSASLAFVRGIHRWPMDSHKGPVTRKIYPFDGVIMKINCYSTSHELHASHFVVFRWCFDNPGEFHPYLSGSRHWQWARGNANEATLTNIFLIEYVFILTSDKVHLHKIT